MVATALLDTSTRRRARAFAALAGAPVGTPAGPTPSPGTGTTPRADIVDEWGRQSFPASDPPANW